MVPRASDEGCRAFPGWFSQFFFSFFFYKLDSGKMCWNHCQSLGFDFLSFLGELIRISESNPAVCWTWLLLPGQ